MTGWTPLCAALAGIGVALFHLRNKKKGCDRLIDRLKYSHSSKESIEQGRSFIPRPSDVFIATYPKSGTTWVQQLCHGIRTGGNMDFEEISTAVPWNTTALDCDQRLDAEQAANPRFFKTHDNYHEVPKGAKYILVLRNPVDVLVSFHVFLCGWGNMKPHVDLGINEFAKGFFLGKGSEAGNYWRHLLTWLPHFEDPNVLVLFFEDLKQELDTCVRRISQFSEGPGQTFPPEFVRKAAAQGTYAFMSRNATKFDDHVLKQAIERRHGYIISGQTDKVRKGGGQVGQGSRRDSGISESTRRQMDQRWKEIIHSRYPELSDYQALRRKFGLQQHQQISQ